VSETTKRSTQNYHPISLLVYLEKVVQIINLRELKKQEGKQNDLHIIPDEKFGFRRNYRRNYKS